MLPVAAKSRRNKQSVVVFTYGAIHYNLGNCSKRSKILIIFSTKSQLEKRPTPLDIIRYR